jgi:hypothetical protein
MLDKIDLGIGDHHSSFGRIKILTRVVHPTSGK